MARATARRRVLHGRSVPASRGGRFLHSAAGRHWAEVACGRASTVLLLRDRDLHLLGRPQPPHDHAVYGEHEAWIVIAGASVLHGWLPTRALRLVRTWHRLHQNELEAAWELVKANQAPGTIEALP